MTVPTKPPRPPRPLGREGKRLWSRIWRSDMAWINRTNDIEHVLVLCESVDERVGLRLAVLRNQDEWRTRNQLRALDSQIVQMIASLGLNPSDRKMLSVEQPVAGKLAELRALRSS